MTNDLPSVGTEDATGLNIELQIIAGFMHDPRPRSAINRATELLRALVSERDELASRVRELEEMNRRQTVEVAEKRELRDRLFERLDAQRKRIGEMHGALSQISEMTFDPWTNGAIAKQIADAALNASKEHP